MGGHVMDFIHVTMNERINVEVRSRNNEVMKVWDGVCRMF